jgi:acyl transferase domain-containing protein
MPRLPVVSNLTGAVAVEELTSPRYWRRHLREPVRFKEGMSALVTMGVTHFVEIGPHPSLIAMARRFTSGVELQWLASLRRDRDDAEQMLETLGALYANGAQIDWKNVACSRGGRRIAAPTYPFQRESFWIGERGEGRSPKRTTLGQGSEIVALATHGPDVEKAADEMVYEMRWKDAAPVALSSVAGERWLVVGGTPELSRAVVEAAERSAVRVATRSRRGSRARSTMQRPPAVSRASSTCRARRLLPTLIQQHVSWDASSEHVEVLSPLRAK